MPVIVAVCPYCRVGQVRAPDRAVGLAANCPKCQSSFTISPSEVHTPSAPVLNVDTAPVLDVAETSPAPIVVDRPSAAPAVTVAPADPPEPALVPALIALSLGGVALAGTQLPYGRIISAAVAGVGLPLALFTLVFAEKKRLVPSLASAANGLALVFVLLVPHWLGMGPWVPPPPAEPPDIVRSIEHGTGATQVGAEWVDATKSSWALDDVRVTVRTVAVTAVELAGPGGKKKWTKDKPLQITVRVANDGVVRKFDFAGWRKPLAPVLTDSSGAVLAERAFEKGWDPPDQPWTVPLFPGKATEQTFYFDPPARSVEHLRLELPGAAVGLERPVRLHIPRSLILAR